MSTAATNILAQYLPWRTRALISFRYRLDRGVGLLSHGEGIHLDLSETTKLFFQKVYVPVFTSLPQSVSEGNRGVG